MLSAEAKTLDGMTIPDITKNESSNCFIIHCFEEKTTNTSSHRTAFEIIHCSHNLEISQLSTRRQLSNLYVALISKVN